MGGRGAKYNSKHAYLPEVKNDGKAHKGSFLIDYQGTGVQEKTGYLMVNDGVKFGIDKRKDGYHITELSTGLQVGTASSLPKAKNLETHALEQFTMEQRMQLVRKAVSTKTESKSKMAKAYKARKRSK